MQEISFLKHQDACTIQLGDLFSKAIEPEVSELELVNCITYIISIKQVYVSDALFGVGNIRSSMIFCTVLFWCSWVLSLGWQK
jgi:hypothetical protein